MTLFVGTKCPKCKKNTLFPSSKTMEIDGEICGPLTSKCSSCGWEPSDEEVIKRWREIKDE